MNREIKFRVWDTYNKEMLDVQELDYADSYNGQPMIRTTMYNDYFDTEEMILMQFTGLHDKNGKEIYEGDIVELKANNGCCEMIGTIIYDEYDLAFELRDIEEETQECLWYAEQELEVIGNIYDNPELLGGE